eukprot:422166-Pelagomonas_calceolata.AAC.1
MVSFCNTYEKAEPGMQRKAIKGLIYLLHSQTLLATSRQRSTERGADGASPPAHSCSRVLRINQSTS